MKRERMVKSEESVPPDETSVRRSYPFRGRSSSSDEDGKDEELGDVESGEGANTWTCLEMKT